MNKQRWQDVVTVVLGFYVFFSPWLIPYFSPSSAVSGAAEWNHYVVGAVIVAIGVAALASYSLWEEWVEAALGLWLIVAPWILKFSEVRSFTWSAIVVGIVVVLMSMGSLAQLKQFTEKPPFGAR